MTMTSLSRNIITRLSDNELDQADTTAILSERDSWLSETDGIGGDLSEAEYAILVALNAEVQTAKTNALNILRVEQQMIAARYGLLPPENPSLTKSFAMMTSFAPGRVISVTPEAASELLNFTLSHRPDAVTEEAFAGAAAGAVFSGAVTAATAAGGIWETTVVGARLGRFAGWGGLAVGAAIGLGMGVLYWAFDD